jgi:hypothetical protein
VRARPQADVRVRVYSTAPNIEVIRRVSRAPVVKVSTKRVTVNSNQRTFVRVESSAPRRQVVVPVGPQYKRVTVRSHNEPPRGGSVTIVKESGPGVRRAEPVRSNVEVRSSSGRSNARHVTVEDDVETKAQPKKKVVVKKKN